MIFARENGGGADFHVVTSATMLEPKNKADDAFLLEFKVHEPDEERSLTDTVAAALEAKGIPADRIRRYGFAFEGKKVLIG